MLQLQPGTGVPASIPEPEMTVPTRHPAELGTPLRLQEDALLVIPHDVPPSPEDDPPYLECETHRFRPNPVKVPPQQLSSPPPDNEHEAQEQDHDRTHATRFNSRKKPKPCIYQVYIKLELSNKPALSKF